MLEVRNVSKRYGKKQALSKVSCQFGTGVYGLLGPNGAGKSTLLQIMTDNLTRDEGQVLYEKADIRANRRYKQDLGYLPQIQEVYEDFTAWQFLEYLALLKGLRREAIPGQIRRVLETVGLLENARQKLSTFSGGMKQRVLVAQALLGQPKVLILDEPTAGLDPKERISLRNHISRAAETATVILATHVVSDVESIAKEVLLLGAGVIRRQGSVEALCRELDGRVFQGELTADQLETLERAALLSNIQELADGRLLVRCLAGEKAARDFGLQPAAPNLQEVYLHTFATPGKG